MRLPISLRRRLRIFALLAAACCTEGCTNEGWYFEVTQPPPGECVTYVRRVCGLTLKRRFQIDWFVRDNNDSDRRPPLNRLYAVVPRLAGGTPIHVLALKPYGEVRPGEPLLAYRYATGLTAFFGFSGMIVILFLIRVKNPVLLVLHPLLFPAWVMLVTGSIISFTDIPAREAFDLKNSLWADTGDPRTLFGTLQWLSMIATVIDVAFLPRTTRRSLGLSLTETVLVAYFSLRRVDVLEQRRRRYMNQQEGRRIEEERRRLDREEQDLLARMRSADIDPREFFEMLERIPRDVGDFAGYVEEVKRRWIERQVKKSVQVTQERLQAMASLYGSYAAIQKQKAEMVRAYEAFKRVHRDIENDALEQELKKNQLLTRLEGLRLEQSRLAEERKAVEGRAAGDLAISPRVSPLTLGRTVDDEEPRSISVPAALQTRHLYIIGQTQMGKTTLIQNLVRQDMQYGHGCAFIDPHGDAVPELLSHVPEHRIDDVVLLDFTRERPVVAFNPLAAAAPDERHGLVEDFMSYFAKFSETDMTVAPRMTHLLRYSLLTLLGGRTAYTVGDLERLLVDTAFRQKILNEVADRTIHEFWERQFAGDVKRVEAQPILTRLSALLAPGSQLRAILTQPENRVDFNDILNSSKILLVRLSKGRGLEAATHFLGALIVTKIQQQAMARADISRGERRPFRLYVDEFQNYAVASFETILAESAKYRLNVVMANQTFHSISASLRTAILGNVGTIVAFRIGSEDARVLQHEIRMPVKRRAETPTGKPTVEEVWYPSVEDLTNQRPHTAFVRLGRPEAVESIRTDRLPPAPANGAEIAREVRARSLRRYYAEPGGARPPRGGGKSEDFLE